MDRFKEDCEVVNVGWVPFVASRPAIANSKRNEGLSRYRFLIGDTKECRDYNWHEISVVERMFLR